MQQLILKQGNFYLSSSLYEKYFNSIQAIALLEKQGKCLIIPIQSTGGGYLLKIKNTKGDRVVHAWDFLNQQGVDISIEYKLDVSWDTELAALTFELPAS